MRSRWRIVPFHSEIKLLSGGTPKKSQPSYWGGDIPWVSSGEMTQRRIHDTQLHVTEEGMNNGTRLVPKNTVLVVVRGMSLAKEFRISLTTKPTTFNQDLKALQPSANIDPWFLFYYLQSQRNAIRDSATDASHGTKKIETRVLGSWPLPLPDISEQYAIRDALCSYDDLIENNRRRIQLLEQAARLLYREWFVRLRFPGHEHVKIKNGVPEGWEKRTLGNLCVSVNYGYTARAQKEKIGPKLLRITDIVSDVIDWPSVPYCEITEKELDKFRLQEGDVVVARTGATVGYAKRIPSLQSPTVFASYLVRFRFGDEIDDLIAGIFMESDVFKAFVLGNAGGAAQPNANAKVLSAANILKPPIHIQAAFRECIGPIIHQKEALCCQNEILRKARDLLLPKLMNGEITI